MLLLPIDACSSPSSLPTKDDATRTSEALINQALDGIHYSGPHLLDVITGPCHETDPQHGTVAVWFYFPGTQTADRSNAIFASLLAYWRGNGYSGADSHTANGVTRGASATKDGYTIGAGLVNGVISMNSGSCYSTPGPQAPVTATVTATS